MRSKILAFLTRATLTTIICLGLSNYCYAQTAPEKSLNDRETALHNADDLSRRALAIETRGLTILTIGMTLKIYIDKP